MKVLENHFSLLL